MRKVSISCLIILYCLLIADCVSTKISTVEQDSFTFSIAVFPDTQYYISERHGGTLRMFGAQVEWVKDNREKENIVYVIHLGDITNNGLSIEQWRRAKSIMYRLESPVSIPYGIAVGNHDSRYDSVASTEYYNDFFGVEHFKGRPYYGGHYGNNNDNHYDLISAGGIDFIIIYLEYDEKINSRECSIGLPMF